MVIYDNNSIERLENKLDYETFVLKFILEEKEILKGKFSPDFFYYGINACHYVKVEDRLGSAISNEFLETFCPFTFVAAFKVLDMIFEWILEEHEKTNEINKVPYGFKEKDKLINRLKTDGNLHLPSIMQSNNYIFDYSYELYKNLRIFRNEIIHNKKFKLSDGKLKITAKLGTSNNTRSIELENEQIDALINVVLIITDLLLSKIHYGNTEENSLKYNFDQLFQLHNLSLFNQQIVKLNVIAIIDEKNGKFSLNLKYIRDQLASVMNSSGNEVLFKLIMVGYRGNSPSNFWLFNAYDVPQNDILEITSNDYNSNIISLERLKSIVTLEEIEKNKSIIINNR